MAETGDIIKEFKEAKPPEKTLIILAVFAVIGIALYWRTKSATQSQGTVGMGGPTASTGGGSPFATIPQGQTPVLPQGINPVYDPSGNVVAYGPGGTTMPPTTTPPIITPPPTTAPPAPSTFAAMSRGLWPGQTDNGTGAIPIWKNPNANWNEDLGGIPLNQQVQIGTAVKGNYFGKQATYYPITYQGTTGYVGSWDLANIPQGAGAVGRPHGMPPRGVSYTRKVVRGHTVVAATYSRRGRQ